MKNIISKINEDFINLRSGLNDRILKIEEGLKIQNETCIDIKSELLKKSFKSGINDSLVENQDITHSKILYSSNNYNINNESKAFFKSLITKSNVTSEMPDGLIPQSVSRNIINLLNTYSPIRKICNVVQIKNGDSYTVFSNAEIAKVGWVNETDPRNETDIPKISGMTIKTAEMYAKPVISQRMIDDVVIDIEDWILSIVTESISIEEDKQFVNGIGDDGKPIGLLNKNNIPTDFFTTKDDCVIRADDKIECFIGTKEDKQDCGPINAMLYAVNSLDNKYSKNAKWLMSKMAAHKIRTIRDGHGRYVWQQSLSDNLPSYLFGHEVIICDSIPDIDNDSMQVMLGDFRRAYTIVDRQGIRMMKDPYTNKPFVEIYVTKRVGGALVDKNAIKLIKLMKK